MKNEIEELMMLTPKRKSILWEKCQRTVRAAISSISLKCRKH